jgi:hypothetical protein
MGRAHDAEGSGAVAEAACGRESAGIDKYNPGSPNPDRRQIIILSREKPVILRTYYSAIQLSPLKPRCRSAAIGTVLAAVCRVRRPWSPFLDSLYRSDCHFGLPMITSLENVTDAEEFQSYLDWITVEFDEDRMDGAEAQRRLHEARRFLFELRPDLRAQYSTMTNQ